MIKTFVLFLFTLAASAQTKLPVAQLSTPAWTNPCLVVMTGPATFTCALLDTSLTLVPGVGTGQPTIKSVGFSGVPQFDSMVIASIGAPVTLKFTPLASTLILFRNGLFMTPTIDYTITGNVITFTSGQVLVVGDNIAAFYCH